VPLKEYLPLIKILCLFIAVFNPLNVERLAFLFFRIPEYRICQRFQSRKRILKHEILGLKSHEGVYKPE